MNRVKFLILLTVFIDIIGLGIVIPILPFYLEGFTSSAFVITSLFSVYALFSFLSAPVIGALSDRLGRRPMLIASLFSTSFGWLVFSFAPNLLWLFAGRIIDGAAAGNLPIAQAYLTDIAKTPKERSANLGLIGAVFGVAFILGPSLGGLLSTVSSSFPFLFVGVLALINAILAVFFLPETHLNRHSHSELSWNPIIPIVRAVKDSKLRLNYLAWFLFGLSVASFQSIFALYAGEAFGFKEVTLGLVFAGMGVIIALNQAVALKHFWLKYFKEPGLELGMLVLYAVGLWLGVFTNLYIFILALVLMTFGQSVLRVVMNSQVLSMAEPHQRGEVLGVLSSVTSLSMTMAPAFAGYIFGLNPKAPFIIAGAFLILALIALLKKRKVLRETVIDENIEVISEI